MKLALGIIAGVILFICLIVGGTAISTYNTLKKSENHIEMLYETNQNELSNYSLQIAEKFQINQKYAGDIKEIIEKTMSGRYGNDNDLLMKFVKEQNIELDSKMYLDLMNTIASGRNSFKLAQDERANSCRLYKNKLKTFPSNIFAGWFGFSFDNIKDSCELVQESSTRKIFEDKTQEAIKFN